ncbi:hypothetical protein PG990_013663 [Apiospora arundinis]
MQISSAFLLSSVFGTSVVSGAAIQPRAAGDRALVSLTGQKAYMNPTDIVQISSGITQGLEPVKKRNNADGLRGRSIIAAIVTVLGIVGTAALEEITTQAVDAAVELIKNVSEWNEAREEFSKATVKRMMEANPGPPISSPPTTTWPTSLRSLPTSTRLPVCPSSRNLMNRNTDRCAILSFDCMYLKGPNTFYTEGDNGYVNLAYDYITDRCTFDKSTGDLTCK